MHVKCDNYRVEYWDPIDVMDYPTNIEIDIYQYQKGTNKKWTNDFTHHLIVDLERIIALDAYMLHMVDEEVFNNYTDGCQGFALYIIIGVIDIQM